MAVGVSAWFDSATESSIRAMWKLLADAGLSRTLHDGPYRPHITHAMSVSLHERKSKSVVTLHADSLKNGRQDTRLKREKFDERSYSDHVRVSACWIGYRAVTHDVVGDDQCAWTGQLKCPRQVLRTARLVSIDEHDIERLGAFGQCINRVAGKHRDTASAHDGPRIVLRINNMDGHAGFLISEFENRLKDARVSSCNLPGAQVPRQQPLRPFELPRRVPPRRDESSKRGGQPVRRPYKPELPRRLLVSRLDRLRRCRSVRRSPSPCHPPR